MERRRPEKPGSFIGQRPEAAEDTIPGGESRKDERVAGTATRSSGTGAAKSRAQERGQPGGHREGPSVTDDRVRQAGENG